MAGCVRCQPGAALGIQRGSPHRFHHSPIHRRAPARTADVRIMLPRTSIMEPLEQRTIAKVSARLVPFLIVCYFVAYLDRVNVSFAALTMNKDLGLSASAFGFGAGIFFLAYFLFEVPSNLLLERVGARKWIARIMFTWGLLSGGMAFIGGETGFYVVRALLGIAEAGFFPGIIFFLTLWFPAVYRARIVGYFMAAIPLSTVIGAPVSGLLVGLDGLMGLKGWQWVFFLPQIVKAFGISNVQAGLVAALPYVVGLVSIVLWGRRSDRVRERRFHLAFPLFVASAGIAISTTLEDPTMKMVALSVAGFGI